MYKNDKVITDTRKYVLEGIDYRQYLRDQIKEFKAQYPNNEMLNGIKIK